MATMETMLHLSTTVMGNGSDNIIYLCFKIKPATKGSHWPLAKSSVQINVQSAEDMAAGAGRAQLDPKEIDIVSHLTLIIPEKHTSWDTSASAMVRKEHFPDNSVRHAVAL